MKTCAFVTTCWERDWRCILLDPDYLKVRQIENHRYPFEDRLLVINNVNDLASVKKAAEDKIREGVITRYLVVDEIVEEMLSFFCLKRSDFKVGPNACEYKEASSDWIYYNALGPLAAIYSGTTDYVLYLTGDVRLDYPVSWIEKALRVMEKKERVKVANLLWNEQYGEAKQESYKKTWNFFFSKRGFSDQMFLVKRSVFRAPIYGQIHPDSSHFPRGDVFEKRVFSYLLNHHFERIIFRRGSYTHENL